MIGGLLAWCGRWPLFLAITIWIIVAISVFTGIVGLWSGGTWWPWLPTLESGTTLLDLVKIALTTIGGIGAVGYLVIKYRERASLERDRIDEQLLSTANQLVSAVNQLGHASPQVRIAGVYALEDLATPSNGQRVVNILCGYLRTNRDNDAAVESTIINVFATHLRKRRIDEDGRGVMEQGVPDDQLWCDHNFDLHGATFTEFANFGGATFNKVIDFRGATFTDSATFLGATFTDSATFLGATFTHWASFDHATFTDSATFLGATFTDGASFDHATFTGLAYFTGATFTDGASFDHATFTDGASFDHATFTDGASFDHATFNYYMRDGILFTESEVLPLRDGIPKDAVWWDFSTDQPANPDNDKDVH